MTNLTKLLASTILLLTACTTRLPRTNSDYAQTSAMITLENKHSGGSGVIVRSYPNGSLILTNKHVCNLIQNGGVVSTDEGTYPVYSFQVYKRHDLCLIKVLANLHENTQLASKAPDTYSNMTIAGHPALLPTIVTHGNFAHHINIDVMIGSQPCDGHEADNDAFMCLLTGQKPLVQSFEAQPVTATIMAGSSGSGVFNSQGEISGLVFAGQQGLSYGFIVPYEYVKDFLTHSNEYAVQYPDPNAKPQNFFISSFFNMQSICDENPANCKGMMLPSLYNEQP
jgi:Trypsin-like peptidase domain